LPIDGASVHAAAQILYDSRWTVAKTDGTYAVQVPAGTYDVSFGLYSTATSLPHAPYGFGFGKASVTVADGETRTGVDVKLDPNGRISGTVSAWTDGGLTTTQAHIRATAANGAEFAGRALSDGQYAIDLPEGNYTVSFSQSPNFEEPTVTSTGVVVKAVAKTAADAVFGTKPAEQPLLDIVAGIPTIGGTAELGKTLTINVGKWTPSDVSFAYQWFRGGDAIAGATGSSYELTQADVGATLSASVAASKSGYTSKVRTADKVGPVTDPNPASVVVPKGDVSPAAPNTAKLTVGTQADIVANDSLRVGGTVTLTIGTQFAGQQVDVWLFSTPTYLGRATVDAAGKVTVAIPTGVPAGAHRLAAVDTAGEVIAWTRVDVAAARAATVLPRTGGEVGGPLAAGLALFVLGGLAVGFSQLRRRATAKATPIG
jgi:hypothetical protein